jgi:hypothetical protein
VSQLRLDWVSFPGLDLYIWTGPTFLTLDAKETLVNQQFLLPPGDAPSMVHHGVVGMDRGAKTLFDFGTAGTLLLEQKSNILYPMAPGKIGIGVYRGTWRIAGGTNRFANATGTISEMGPYLVWPRPGSPDTPFGAYNGEFNGHICGVTPAQ